MTITTLSMFPGIYLTCTMAITTMSMLPGIYLTCTMAITILSMLPGIYLTCTVAIITLSMLPGIYLTCTMAITTLSMFPGICLTCTMTITILSMLPGIYLTCTVAIISLSMLPGIYLTCTMALTTLSVFAGIYLTCAMAITNLCFHLPHLYHGYITTLSIFSGIYLTCTMAITTLSMVLTVFILNLHHVSDRPVPRWAKKLVLVYLARLLCMCQFQKKIQQEEREREERKNRYRITPNSLGKAIGNQIGLLANLNGGGPPTDGPSHGGNRNLDPYSRALLEKRGSHFTSQYQFTFDRQGNKDPDMKDPKGLEDDWSRDWRHLAEVMDRLFFWMFLSAIVITTLLLFHPLTKSYFSLLGDETILKGEEEGEERSQIIVHQ